MVQVGVEGKEARQPCKAVFCYNGTIIKILADIQQLLEAELIERRARC